MTTKTNAETKAKTLTAQFVKSATEQGLYPDGPHPRGLYLQVEHAESKQWIFRYMLLGRRRHMGLGSYPAIGLTEARNKRDDARNKVKNGTDPIDARKAERRAKKKEIEQRITLAEAHERWLNAPRQKEWNGTDWGGSTSYRETWLWALYGGPNSRATKPVKKTTPWLGPYQLSDVVADNGRLIIEAFRDIMSNQRYKKSAKYALQHLSKIIEWAKDEYKLPIDNPINLKPDSKFRERLPSLEYEVANRRAMPWQDVPAFIARLREEKGTAWGGRVGGYCLDERPLPTEVMELQILTGGRPAQARLAQWDEFDLDKRIWRVPLHTTVNEKRFYRRKRKDAFVIYINRQAVHLLREIKKRQEEKEGGLRKFVFSHPPARTAGEGYHISHALRRQETSRYGDSDFRYGGMPITAGAVQSYFRISMGVKEYDLYGFRSSFKQFQIQRFGYAAELAGEAVLHHKVGNYVRNVYAQEALPENQITEVLDFWGAHCDGKQVSAAMRKQKQEEKL
jgi:integrase